jgi:hypothetical protein
MVDHRQVSLSLDIGVGMGQISKQRIQIRTFNLRLRSHQNSKTAKPPEQQGSLQPK